MKRGDRERKRGIKTVKLILTMRRERKGGREVEERGGVIWEGGTKE
jgi:hypothetical protein